jgi:hypothetical protein
MQVAQEEPYAPEREAELRTVFHHLPLFEERPYDDVSVLSVWVKKEDMDCVPSFVNFFVTIH